MVVAISWGIVSYDSSKLHMSWFACFLISISAGIFLSIWFSLIKDRQNIDWTKPISPTLPFFPMNQYPVRYWVVVATALVIGGSLSFVIEVTKDGQHATFGATFMLLGAAIFLAASPWLRNR